MNRAQIALSDRFGSIKIVHSKRNQTLPMRHIWLVPIIAVSFGDCRLFGRHWAKLLLHQCDVIKWMDGECPFTPPLGNTGEREREREREIEPMSGTLYSSQQIMFN